MGWMDDSMIGLWGDGIKRASCTILTKQTSQSNQNRYPTWGAIPWRVKRRFFSTWLLLISLGTALALASAVLNLVQRQNYAPSLLSHKACAGAACFLLWASALRYLEPYPKVYAIIPVVNAAVARLAPFLAGFIPIFVGFALLGMACFGRGTVTFGTFSNVSSFLGVWGVYVWMLYVLYFWREPGNRS